MTTEDAEFERAASRIGEVLREKYRLDRVLGVGGMAAVYVATHRNRKEFAIKLLHPAISRDPDTRARFLREGYAANSVGHPGAVAVLDDDTAEDGSAFLVMELLQGVTVDSLWEARGRLSTPDVLALTVQLLDVLAAAHEKNIVHRDIKPANLFLTKDGSLKVLDFGIARVRDLAVSDETAAGSLLGTPAFMPPEQAQGKVDELDGRSDLWAVGATMFALLSGRCVHDGDNVQKVMILAATTAAPSLRDALPDAHALVANVVDRALAFHKEDRFPSALAMKHAAEDAYHRIAGRPLTTDALVPLVAPGASAAAAPVASLAADPTVPAVAGSFAAGSFAIDPTLLANEVPSIVRAPVRVASAAPAASATMMRESAEPRASKSRTPLALVVAGLALCGGLGVFYVARAGQRDAEVAQSQFGQGEQPLLPPPPPMPTSSAGATGSDSAAPPGTSTPSAVSSSIAPSPRPAPAPKTSKPASAGKQAGKAKDCNPNYTLDSAGEKHFKAECFR